MSHLDSFYKISQLTFFQSSQGPLWAPLYHVYVQTLFQHTRAFTKTQRSPSQLPSSQCCGVEGPSHDSTGCLEAYESSRLYRALVLLTRSVSHHSNLSQPPVSWGCRRRCCQSRQVHFPPSLFATLNRATGKCGRASSFPSIERCREYSS